MTSTCAWNITRSANAYCNGELRFDVIGLGEMASADEESELQRQERHIKEKQDAEARGLPLPPRPITEQNFMQYMHMVEEGRRQEGTC